MIGFWRFEPVYQPNFETRWVYYLNWDNEVHRAVILSGPSAEALHLGLLNLREALPVVVFDEIHKYRHWKQFLKVFLIFSKRDKSAPRLSNVF